MCMLNTFITLCQHQLPPAIKWLGQHILCMLLHSDLSVSVWSLYLFIFQYLHGFEQFRVDILSPSLPPLPLAGLHNIPCIYWLIWASYCCAWASECGLSVCSCFSVSMALSNLEFASAAKPCSLSSTLTTCWIWFGSGGEKWSWYLSMMSSHFAAVKSQMSSCNHCCQMYALFISANFTGNCAV